ncbi:MAG: ribosome-binding factor A [Wolbachia endosymbiont of Tyrophagus putrescentiae]|nr:ribosome-binding factor A [Wolbachia endosymbiont of Tyrophagus putrescentiae]
MKKEIRRLKIASVLHRAISKILMEDKVFERNILVSSVELSKDLSKADVYIVLSSLNEGGCDINSAAHEINKSAWLIRKSVSHHVDLRFIPELIFKPDLAFENFINVNKILSC